METISRYQAWSVLSCTCFRCSRGIVLESGGSRNVFNRSLSNHEGITMERRSILREGACLAPEDLKRAPVVIHSFSSSVDLLFFLQQKTRSMFAGFRA